MAQLSGEYGMFSPREVAGIRGELSAHRRKLAAFGRAVAERRQPEVRRRLLVHEGAGFAQWRAVGAARLPYDTQSRAA